MKRKEDSKKVQQKLEAVEQKLRKEEREQLEGTIREYMIDSDFLLAPRSAYPSLSDFFMKKRASKSRVKEYLQHERINFVCARSVEKVEPFNIIFKS